MGYKERIPTIYTITNIVDGKIYLGYAINYKNRWLEHLGLLRRNKHYNSHLQYAYNKYGEENFLFEILVECEEQYLASEEHYWATLLNVHDDRYGYNIRPTDPNKTPTIAEETIKKIVEKTRGSKRTETTKRLMSKKAIEREITPAIIAGVEKRKRTIKEKYGSQNSWVQGKIGEISQKAIIQMQGESIIKQWPSIVDMLKELGIDYGVLAKLIKGDYKRNSKHKELRKYNWIIKHKNK